MTNFDRQEVLLRVENLSQHFKSLKAVDDVSFEVKRGEVFGLVGESGCGKTTTGRSILRIYDITGGSIYFKGHRICAGTLEYNRAIREAAEYLGCGLIEFDKDGITFENCYSEGFITDSATIPTHPNDKGHRVMGKRAVLDLTRQYVPLE